MNPFPFLVSEILASNIGGASTLIGDPPNILIGSAAGLDFVAFLVNMAPLSALLLAVYLVAARWLFRGQLDVDPELRDCAPRAGRARDDHRPRLCCGCRSPCSA